MELDDQLLTSTEAKETISTISVLQIRKFKQSCLCDVSQSTMVAMWSFSRVSMMQICLTIDARQPHAQEDYLAL